MCFRFKPAERKVVDDFWMTAFKTTIRVPVDHALVGQMIVLHSPNEVDEEADCYWPFIVIGKTLKHVRLACVLDVHRGTYDGCTVPLTEECVVLNT